MRQEILDRFWKDFYKNSSQSQTRLAVENLLEQFRETLNASTKTAIAIDMDYSIEEIIQRAENEGQMELGQILRFAKLNLDTSGRTHNVEMSF